MEATAIYQRSIEPITTSTERVEETVEIRYICHTCNHVLFGIPPHPGAVAICPDCGAPMREACHRDHPCTCGNEIHSGIAYCPDCGDPICPDCGSHDVAQISRVTGYLAEVSGWNKGKQQELKDRDRYNAQTGEQVNK